MDTKLARVRVAKTLRDDVEGVSTTDLSLAYGAEKGSVAYVGVVGSVHGRSGSFVLYHTVTSSPDGQSAAWSVVPDGGHSFSLDHDLD